MFCNDQRQIKLRSDRDLKHEVFSDRKLMILTDGFAAVVFQSGYFEMSAISSVKFKGMSFHPTEERNSLQKEGICSLK